jgi:hypothetical protein
MRVRKVALCAVVAVAVVTAIVPNAMSGRRPRPGGTQTTVSALRLTPSTFKANQGATVAFTTDTSNKTTAMSFNMSAASRVGFKVFGRFPNAGRRVNGKCVGRTFANRNKPKCVLLQFAGRFFYDAAAGTNSLRYQGWAQRSLRPGLYRMELQPIRSNSKAIANFKLTR